MENITSSVSQSGTDNQAVITFHAPFSDENYCLLLTVHSLAINNAIDAIPTIWEQGLASATIKVYDYNVNALKFSWFACGY